VERPHTPARPRLDATQLPPPAGALPAAWQNLPACHPGWQSGTALPITLHVRLPLLCVFRHSLISLAIHFHFTAVTRVYSFSISTRDCLLRLSCSIHLHRTIEHAFKSSKSPLRMAPSFQVDEGGAFDALEERGPLSQELPSYMRGDRCMQAMEGAFLSLVQPSCSSLA
jgi:hypothetical protein